MKIKYYIYSLIASMMVLCSACSPDSFDLGTKDITADDLAVGIAYTVTHDSENPNIVYLKSLVDSKYTVVWDHPQGRSQKKEVTLKMPFPGTYTVTFGVETRGGVVYGTPITFTVDDFYAGFVTDELWTKLTGGVGQSKTWYLDINKDGVCKYFVGPLYFYGTADSWETVTEGKTLPSGSDSWNWQADWASNGSWLFGDTGAMDYGSMTFDLINGANLTVVDNHSGTTTKGTFLMDTDNHTMSMNNVKLLHDSGRDAIVTAWGNITIMSLTDDYMQLGVLRDNDPTDGPCLLVYNFISKDYSDNWTAPSTDNAAPELPENWQDEVTQVTNQTIKWKLSGTSPFDWCDLYGTRKNGFTALTDYKSWCTPVSNVGDITLTLNNKTKAYTLELPDLSSVTGTYTLSSEGIYTFDKGLSSYLIGSNWIYFSTDGDMQLRLMSYELNTTGTVSDMWLGAKQKNTNGKVYQYLAYHFVAQQDATQEVTYEATMSAFESGNWARIDGSATSFTKSGNYTAIIQGSSSTVENAGTTGWYIDIPLILKDHPNATFSVISITADGNNVTFDSSLIDATATGDLTTTARILLKNAWGTGMEIPNFSTSLSVTFSVAFND